MRGLLGFSLAMKGPSSLQYFKQEKKSEEKYLVMLKMKIKNMLEPLLLLYLGDVLGWRSIMEECILLSGPLSSF